MEVESRETDTSGTGATEAGFCVVQWDEIESLQALLVDIVYPLEVLYDTLLRLLNELADVNTGTLGDLSESNLSKLSMHRRENLLKQEYFSGCLTVALANILRKNPLESL